jgi:hypothetical protein
VDGALVGDPDVEHPVKPTATSTTVSARDIAMRRDGAAHVTIEALRLVARTKGGFIDKDITSTVLMFGEAADATF